MARFSEPGQCQRTKEQEDATLVVDREHEASSQWLLLTVMLQLIEPKFRPDPLRFARGPEWYVLCLVPPRQGNRSRTVGEGRNNVPNWFARCDFHLEFQRDEHTHYPTTVTCSENRPKVGIIS